MRLYNVDGFKMEDGEDVEHHGIKGQQWGRRRYQNPDGTLTPLGKKRLQAKQQRAIRKEQKAELKVLKKQYKQAEKERKEQEKFEDKKQKLLTKGSREDVYKNSDMFTDRELQEFTNRQRLLDQLKPADAPSKRDVAFEKAQKFVDRTAKTVKMGSELFNAYKMSSSIINNLAGKEVLPEFDLAKKNQKAKEATEKANKAAKEARARVLAAMTPEQIAKNYGKFTTEELKDLSVRATARSNIEKQYADQLADYNKAKGASSEAKFRSNKAYDFAATKSMLSSYGNQTYSQYSQDISSGKKAVENLINMSSGELGSKWYPSPQATYNVPKSSRTTYQQAQTSKKNKEAYQFIEKALKEFDDYTTELNYEKSASGKMDSVTQSVFTGDLYSSGKKNAGALMSSISGGNIDAARMLADFKKNNPIAQKTVDTLISSISDDEFAEMSIRSLREDWHKQWDKLK